MGRAEPFDEDNRRALQNRISGYIRPSYMVWALLSEDFAPGVKADA